MPENPPASKRVYCALSVDGDLRTGDLEQQKAAVAAMRRIHANVGAAGRTTWFVNELDFHWTANHPELLLELVDAGESVGLHDHLDTHYAEDGPNTRPLLESAREKVLRFLEKHGRPAHLRAHRNGCLIQNQASYQALQELGYDLLSDAWPGRSWDSRMVPVPGQSNAWKQLDPGDPRLIHIDNEQIPLSALPWRHDAHNWLDFNSRAGWFLQVPVTTIPWLDEDRIRAAIENGQDAAIVMTDTHPYDLQAEDGQIDPEKVERFQASIERLRDEFRAAFIRIDQVEAARDDLL